MPTVPSATVPGSSNTSPIKKKDRELTGPRDGTVRLFYSLKENPNAIISYSELLRQEQRRQRLATTKHHTTTTSPLRNSKVTSAHTQPSGPSSTAMDVDPPEGEKAEGEEALGEGDSEAEDEDDDEDDEENENEDDAEAEDEDDDEDPDDDDDDDSPGTGSRSFLDTLAEKYVEENGNEGEDEDDEDEDDDGEVRYPRTSSFRVNVCRLRGRPCFTHGGRRHASINDGNYSLFCPPPDRCVDDIHSTVGKLLSRWNSAH